MGSFGSTGLMSWWAHQTRQVTAIMATELERAGLPLRFVSLDIDLDELQVLCVCP